MSKLNEHALLQQCTVVDKSSYIKIEKCNISMDAWTLPNNKVYVAITVHFEENGLSFCLLLDIIEVAHSHTGVNLAAAFAEVLEDFGIPNKVNCLK